MSEAFARDVPTSAVRCAPEPVVAQNAEFTGLLQLPAAGRIDGKIEGEVIAAGMVWIGETGRVRARVEAEEGTQLFEEWLEYDIYQMYLEHRRGEAESINNYAQEAKTAILDRCLSDEDRKRVIDLEDWRKIHTTALSAQLTEEDIAVVLRSNFPGQVPGPGDLGDYEG